MGEITLGAIKRDPRGFLREKSWVGPLWRGMGSSGPLLTHPAPLRPLPCAPITFLSDHTGGFSQKSGSPLPRILRWTFARGPPS